MTFVNEKNDTGKFNTWPCKIQTPYLPCTFLSFQIIHQVTLGKSVNFKHTSITEPRVLFCGVFFLLLS